MQETARGCVDLGMDGLGRLVLLTLGLLAVGSACSPDDPTGQDSRPTGTFEDVMALSQREDLNVLFILVDTLRSDRLSSYGYDRETSPRIDALAESGVRFSQHLSQSSWTKCSMASLWTGLYPNRTGVLRSRHALPDSALLPPEIFRDEGFRTAGIYRNGWLAPNFGFAQGFEIYMSPRPPAAVVSQVAGDPAMVPESDGDAIRAATGFLRSHAQERWFLYVHLLDVHQYGSDEASAIFGTTYSDLYDNAILWTDSLVGNLLDELERHGVRDRTIVILGSDHGEAFGEHEKDGHAYDVYGEVTEVPFIVSFPFKLSPGLVVNSPSENVDIWPTLMELMGLPTVEDPDGMSLLPAMEAASLGETSPDEGTLRFAQLDGTWGKLEGEPSPIVSISEDRWRLIYEGTENPLQLFDKELDPTESRNVAQKRSEIASSLSDRAEAYLQRTDSPWPEEDLSVEIDEMELHQLRALGYGIQ